MNKSIKTAPYNRSVIVGILLAGAFVAILNQTLLITAAPHIMNDFNIDANKAQWLTTSFMLTNGILIPITAFLIEKFTSRTLLISAMSIFTAGTIVGAFAPNFPVLLTARIIQAAGAGIIFAAHADGISHDFPDGKARPRHGYGRLSYFVRAGDRPDAFRMGGRSILLAVFVLYHLPDRSHRFAFSDYSDEKRHDITRNTD